VRNRAIGDFICGVIELIFPNSCLICETAAGQTEPFRHGLCTACYGAVTNDPHEMCLRCGQTVGPHSAGSDRCAGCKTMAFGFHSVIRLGRYDGRLREAVIRMKVSGGESLADHLGRLFGECRKDQLSAGKCDLAVPVPLHWKRAWGRGYNQASAIAEGIAQGLGIPCSPYCLRRIRHTAQQLQPSALARRENVRGAFRLTRGAKVAGKRILLVDDVMTTGSTASEASRILREAGAREVVAGVLARR